MPARTDSAAAPATGAPAPKRFELPAFDFQFKSLTDGTSIPAPVLEEPAPAPQPAAEKKPIAAAPAEPSSGESQPANGASKINGHHTTPSTITTITSGGAAPRGAGVKRPAADPVPASPTASNRPGSIRRLFSRNLLNSAYANGEAHQGNSSSPKNNDFDTASSIGRPDSRSNGSFVDAKRNKRSSGWFSRFRGGNDAQAKRASVVSNNENQPPAVVPKGPPPPMIPELDELKAKVDTSMGDDLFKNIK